MPPPLPPQKCNSGATTVPPAPSPPPPPRRYATTMQPPRPPPPPPKPSSCLQPTISEMGSVSVTSSTKEAGHSSGICEIRPLDLLDPRTAFNPQVSVHLIGGDYHTQQFLASETSHKYVRQSNPTLESIKPLLDNVKEPSVLLLRGCELLLQSRSFPFHKFKSITALEISGSRNLTTLPENTISQMTCLRSLILKGCSNLHVLPEPLQTLDMLEYLDLSHLPIETLPDGFMPSGLRSLILRGCSKLRSLQFDKPESYYPHLNFLDLLHCTSLIAKTTKIPDAVKVLDLSYTALDWVHVPASVSHLFFKNASLSIPNHVSFPMDRIKVCDLSGCENLEGSRTLRGCPGLEALDLSRTGITAIYFISGYTSLRTLVIRECPGLRHFPVILGTINLEVLDLSGCENLGELPLRLNKQRRLKELNLRGCKSLRYLEDGLFDQMSSLENLDLSNTDIEHLPDLANLINIGTVIKHSHATVPESATLGSDNLFSLNEFHLVSTFINNSEFEKLKYRFRELNDYISFLEEKFTMKRQFESLRDDLEYILSKIDLLESSKNWRSSEELLHELMSYDYKNRDDRLAILNKMLRTVTKLKLLVPPPPPPKPPSAAEHGKKLESPPPPKTYHIETAIRRMASAYNSLTTIQRNCLLYFACLPVPISGDKVIKNSILIHLWYGEGFFDHQQVSTSNANRTIGEIGREILEVLHVNGFIEIRRHKTCYIGEVEHSFVITKAMEENSFDYNKHSKLTPKFAVSRRACLLKSDIDHPPSSHVWLNYTKSSQQLESFKIVRTLLYIDEPVVDINIEWFSSMTNLHVLHLVNLYSEQINIVDLKFLEVLKNMKQLRLLNLESFAAIHKLPDSICQLTNLRVVNLKYCSNLMELPVGIGTLANLIILDLTQCHLLPQLPKGLALLSKLEVLKGFSITYKVSGSQSKRACTLRELLRLKRLRKLNLVVNRDSFPDTTDLHVLRNMKELRNLKITWKKNNHKEQELGDTVQNGGLRQSRWKQLKCFGAHNEIEEVEDEFLLTNNLGDLNKLVFCCFPLETAPNWLHPTELQKLERLYFVGGSMRTLFEDCTDHTPWKVKSLKFKYLVNLNIDPSILKRKFPYLPGFAPIISYTRPTPLVFKHSTVSCTASSTGPEREAKSPMNRTLREDFINFGSKITKLVNTICT